VFTKGVLGSSDYIVFSVHVDDKFIACTSEELVKELDTVLSASGFQCKLEPMSKVLGMHVHYTRYTPGIPGSGTLKLCHKEYIQKCFREVHSNFRGKPQRRTVPMTMERSKRKRDSSEPLLEKGRCKLFRKILGQVSHCANFTHPEICTAVSMVSQHMAVPTEADLEDVWNILCYLRGTVDPGHGQNAAVYTLRRNDTFSSLNGSSRKPRSVHPVHLVCDADLSNCLETRRSRTGFALYLFGSLVGWSSSKQKSVALSTAESEYVAMSTAAQYGKWYMELLKDMGLELAWYEPFVMYSDSKSAMAIAKSRIAIVNKYSKHIERRVHWFRELIRAKVMDVKFVAGTENTADIFTKCLQTTLFRKFRDRLLLGDFNPGDVDFVSCVHVMTAQLYMTEEEFYDDL
jgi:hypothetical protein